MDFAELLDTLYSPAIKLGLTVACVGVIGVERQMTGKPAGLRTNILIGLGACLMMILSTEIVNSAGLGDPSRVASQVVTGVGFLGAGTIIQSRGAVFGLTTAATIWVVAGIGLLIGGGYFAYGVLGTAVVLFTLLVLRWLETLLTRIGHRDQVYVVTVKNVDTAVDSVLATVAANGGSVEDRHVEHQEDVLRVTFTHRHTQAAHTRLFGLLTANPLVRDVREE